MMLNTIDSTPSNLLCMILKLGGEVLCSQYQSYLLAYVTGGSGYSAVQ